MICDEYKHVMQHIRFLPDAATMRAVARIALFTGLGRQRARVSFGDNIRNCS